MKKQKIKFGELVEPIAVPVPHLNCKYRPEVCDKIIEEASKGRGTHAQMMVAAGIKSRATFSAWQKEYPEFKEAVEFGDLVFQAWCENLQLMGALGQVPGYNDKPLHRLMAAKFKEYSNAAQAASHTEINIGSINSVNTMPIDEVKKRIEALQKKLGLNNDGPDNPING